MNNDNKEDPNEINKKTEESSLLLTKKIDQLADDIHGYPTMDNTLNKLGYTKHHFFLILSGSLFFFAMGMHLYAFNLLFIIIQKLLNLSSGSRIFMNSCIYLGYAVGSVTFGTMTTIWDRKKPLLVLSVILSISSILIVAWANFYWICVFRFIIGYAIGAGSSAVLSCITEFLPVHYRELMIATIFASKCLGIVVYVIIFKYANPNFEVSKWRMILLFVSIPTVLMTIYLFFVFRESPRLHLNKDRFDEGVSEIRRLCEGSKVTFSKSEEQTLKIEVEIAKTKPGFAFTVLFDKKYLLITLVNLMLMTTTSMAYVSNFFSLPLILSKTKITYAEKINKILIAQAFAVPSIFLAALISSIPFFGRKWTIVGGMSMCFLSALYPSIFHNGLVISSSLINFFIMIAYFMSKVYLLESFPSKLRDHGMSFVLLITRIGESVAPTICEAWFFSYIYGPLIFITILLTVGLIFAFLIPFDTQGENLDSKF